MVQLGSCSSSSITEQLDDRSIMEQESSQLKYDQDPEGCTPMELSGEELEFIRVMRAERVSEMLSCR